MNKILTWITKVWPTIRAGLKKGAAAAKKVWIKANAKIDVTLLILIALLVTFIAVGGLKYNKQPVTTTTKATVKKVVESPTVKQIKAATATITEQTTVKASGTIKTKSKTKATAKESKYTIPLQGESTTTYIDGQTGQTVGQGTHQVTGQANVTVQDDTVTADVTIDDTSQVAVTIKRTKRKNEFAGYGGVAVSRDPYTFIGAYYQRNFLTMQAKKADMALYARASVERRWGADEDWKGRITAGVRVEW
jgi:Flp pilus assembly protein TadG